MRVDPPPNEGAEIAAYSKFYKESVPRLVTFLVCQRFTLLDAADCVQETLIEALPPKWSELIRPYPWCRQVAYRKALALAKKSRELPTADVEKHPVLLSEDRVQAHEQLQEFLTCLSRLDGDQERFVLVWTYDGASPSEIAEELNTTATHVRSTLYRARKKFRELRDQGELR